VKAPAYSEDPAELFSADSIADPHRLFRRLREQHPLARVGDTGVHLVASWDLIDEALHRDADFSAHLTGVLIRGDDGQPATFELPETSANKVIATADEPDHAVHRALAQPRLAPDRIAALEPQIRGWAQEALAPWFARGGGDFAPIAELVPARAVADLLGLPDGDVSRHRKWAMMGGDMLAGDVSLPQIVELATETMRLVEYLNEHLEALRPPSSEPGAPMLHALARGIDSKQLSVEQAIGIGIVMFGAGGESTAGLIGSALCRLAEAPGLADELRGDPSLIPRFIEEVVRLEPPFNFHYRAVRQACRFGGFELQVGDRLMLLWASANRDSQHFKDADALRLDRRHPKHHMSFGRGGHFCIGAPLARLEARIVVEEVLAQSQHLSPCPGDPSVPAHSIFVHRLERLPIAVQ
jgi:cytochrome P450